MKRLLFGSTLCALGLFLLPTQQVQAAVCVNKEVGITQTNGSNPAYPPHARSGSWIYVATGSSSASDCTHYTTNGNWPLSGKNSESKSGKSVAPYTVWDGEKDITIPVISRYSASANSSGLSVSTSVYEYSAARIGGSAFAKAVDLLWISKPAAGADDITQIPFSFCSTLTSSIASHTGSNLSAFTYQDFHFNGESRAGDKIVLTSGLSKITHTSNGHSCSHGYIEMKGKYVVFSIGISAFTAGNDGLASRIDITDTYYITPALKDASIHASFSVSAAGFNGIECFSASGNVEGCEEEDEEDNVAGEDEIDPEKEEDEKEEDEEEETDCSEDTILAANTTASKFSGNPINFALGYKYQKEIDYSGGVLSFTRVYRSDSTWTSDIIGTHWRHNYDRVFNVVTTPATSSINITDSTGARTVFSLESDGSWLPYDPDITTKLESILSGATVVGYMYTTNSDRREYFDTDGLMYRVEYEGGQALDLIYNGSNLLSSVTNENGKSLTFSYNGNSQISGVVTPTGSFSYSYDGNDNLTTVTKPDSKTRIYHYEDTSFVNAMTGITDEKGIRFATYGYNAGGYAISSKHAGDVGEYIFAYNVDGTTTVTNPLGKDTIYTFETIHGVRKIVNVEGQASTNCPAAGKSYVYDERGFMESKTDWLGNVTTYERDDLGSVISLTQALGDGAERTFDVTYITDTRLTDVVTEEGRTTDYDYDGDDRVTSVTVIDTNTSETRTTSYTYYANTTDGNGNTVLGKLHTVDGARTDVSDVTTYTYDGSLRLLKVSNAAAHEVEITSYDSANRPLKFENTNNVETTLVYDVMGRLASSTRASGTASAITTSYAYDDNGNVTSITDPSGTVYSYAYDNAHRLTTITDDLGNTISYTYDDADNITKQEYKDNGATLTYTHSYVYDELSRIMESVDANLDAVEYAYDVNSNVTDVTDGNMNVTSYAFDGLDRLVTSTDALSGVTSLGLNELDQLEDVTDPRSNVTSYAYNAFGDVTQSISPDRGTRTYTHDKGGNVTSMTDARAVVSNYTYDVLNRLASVAYSSDSALDVALTYDSASGCGTSLGRLCSVTDAAGTTTYIYDVLGRLTSTSKAVGALSFTTGYGYDASGVLSSITLPSGRVIAYTLNGNGQVSGVSADVNSTNITLASAITYLPFGGITGFTYGNSITFSDTYNTAYQSTLRQIGSMMYDTHSYDGADNITLQDSDSYTYDALYRLTADGSDTYTYDAIGNRTAKNATGYTYPSTSSRLSDIGANAITTDASGNITADATRTYVIDAAGRLEQVKISGSTVGAYVYNTNNQRTQKTASSTVTHYVYGLGGLLYGEYDNTGALIREYVYLNGQPLAQVESGEVLTYIHTDHLGTPRYATDSSGAQIWAWNSDAFGNGTPSGTATVNLRFAGQYWDDESNLHYNWNRYYDPETGRYISSDPIGLAGGLNTFGYALANPIMYTDPRGLKTPGCMLCDLAERMTRCPLPPGNILNNNEAPSAKPKPEKPEESNSDSGADEGETPPLPDEIVGDNPKKGSGKRTNTDLPSGDFADTVDGLTGGVLNPDPNNPEHQISPNGVRVRPDKGSGPRVDIPANGEKPPETIHFPPGTTL